MSGSTQRAQVLYVGGWGRSGSTVLGQHLGRQDKYFFMGEVRFLWDRGVLRNELCSCGAPFHGCEFWQSVGELRGGWAVGEARRMLELERKYQRYYLVPRLMRGGATRHRGFGDYAERLASLYLAVRDVSGSEVLVDTSKDPQYLAVLLASERLDLSLLHLVRDSRASAFSWSRYRQRPEVTTHREYMPRFGPVAAAREYVLAHVVHELLSHKCPSSTLRYEDFVWSQGSALASIVPRLGLPPLCTGGDGLGSDADHSLGGNPSRFRRGEPKLELDEEWTYAMASGAFAANTLFAAPLLVKYGYPLRRRVQVVGGA